MLPNFLVIGAMKAGTSSLYQYLRRHPQIFMPRDKEPAFFASNWDRGLDWYERLFDGARGAIAIGEASTEYSVYPHIPGVPERVAETLPEVRLVYLVRHPIERMLSEYQYNVVKGVEPGGSADESLLSDPTYETASRYALQIEQYTQHFSSDRLLVVKSEDLRHDRSRCLADILAFLGVDTSWVPPNVEREFYRTSDMRRPRPVDHVLRRMPGYGALAAVAPTSLKTLKYRITTARPPKRPVLSDRVRSELQDRLRDDVRHLRRHLGPDFDGWGIA
jgi:hypothetical protein